MKLPEIKKIGRSAAILLLVAAVLVVYEMRLLQWQLIDGASYKQQAMNEKTDSLVLEAARGQILDKNGVVLAGNKTSYTIVYNMLNMDYNQRNPTIVKVLEILEENGQKWRDRLPILLDEEGNYQFKEDMESEIATLKSVDVLNMADYATAEDCMAELMYIYSCAGYSKKDSRDIASVRYGMVRDGYSRATPYVIAGDVSPEVVGIISQKEKEMPGIEARVAVSRYYGEDGSLAPHIVGFTGLMHDYQYDEAVEKGTAYDEATNPSGYKWTDIRGQGGIESAYEEELRGKRGKENIITDDSGAVESLTVTAAPEEGNTVVLSLDSQLQRVANLSLAENIQDNTVAKNCTSGAVVALNVKDFGVMASASYPNYDMNQYLSNDSYLKLINEDKTKPLFNRALEGIYTPGSVFKPMVAIAALQEGAVSAGTTYYCDGLFEYYDLELKCTGTHGNADLYSGLAGSCNEYFCNVGLNLSIAKMDAYAEYFGLGQETGVELSEEVGRMSGPQEYYENHGQEWTSGLTAQTAIGQCDNEFTPIQLATYCATIANGGVRKQTHFMDKITDYTGETVLREYESKELFDADISSDVLGVVREGMIEVASSPNGTAYSVFGDYPVAIAAKTGTAETGGDKEPHLSFIAFAPANDPEIAVAVVMEYGKDGNYAKNVAKDVLDQYFGYYTWDEEGNRYNQNGDMVDREDKVLKTKDELEQEKAQKEAKADATPGPQGEEGEPTASSTPTPIPFRRDENIPGAPYTGAESSPSPSPEGEGQGGEEGPDPSPSPGPSTVPQSPYWKGD